MTPAPNVVPAYPLAAGVLFWLAVAIFALAFCLAFRPRRRAAARPTATPEAG